MSLLTDIKSVSDSAIEQLSGRFHDLPRPLLAAIGAGDIAVERLAALREQVAGAMGTGRGTPTGDDVKAFAADLPVRVQKITGDVAHHLEQFATGAPERVQQLIGELPARTAEFTDSLAPEKIRGTVEAYTQFVGMIYGNLAERGGKTVAQGQPGKGRRAAAGPAAAAPADSGPEKPATATRRAARGAAKRSGRQAAADAPASQRSAAATAGARATTGAKAGAATAARSGAKTRAKAGTAATRARKSASGPTAPAAGAPSDPAS